MPFLHKDIQETRDNFTFIFQIALYLGVWFLLWRGLSHFSKDKLSKDSHSRLFSLIYGGWSLVFAWANWFCQKRIAADASNTWSENTFLSLTLSYLIADTAIQFSHGIFTKWSVLHHGCSFVALASILITRTGAPVVFAGILITESVNFIQNVRRVLQDLKLRYTKVYLLNEALYIGLFSLSRGLLGPTYIIWILRGFRLLPVGFLLPVVLLTAISYLQVPKVRDYAVQWWQTIDAINVQNVELQWFEEASGAQSLPGYVADHQYSEVASNIGARSKASPTKSQ